MMVAEDALRVAFTTLGCKVNQSETDLYARQFAAAGYVRVPFEESADVYIVNTCTVTHVADRKSRQVLNQVIRRNPHALLVATGCFASVAGNALTSDNTLVIRNRDKDRLLALVEGRLKGQSRELPFRGDLEKYLDMPVGQERTRSMVKAQDGCDSHCTYCIIPRARGRSRSVPPEDVIRRINALVREGHAECVLTGVDLGSYGEDDPSFPDLGGLLAQILDRTEIQRLRVSSLEPGDFKGEWLALWKDPRLCRHLHVPLQAGSATVLERMERKYSPEDFAAMVELCRKTVPDITITTDVMVGFPGESAAEFDEGYDFIREVGFDGMHVFKYSQRSGTRAARMPSQVPEHLKNERSAILREESWMGVQRLIDRHIGKTASVAWEEEREGLSRGVTDTNVRVYAAQGRFAGTLGTVRLTDSFRDGVWSEQPGIRISLIPV